VDTYCVIYLSQVK